MASRNMDPHRNNPSRHVHHGRTESRAYDYLVRLIIIGDEGTGKSSLLSRFTDTTFTPSYVATIGVDFKIRTMEVATEGAAPTVVKLQMWDTAGQERFNSITKSFYRGADVLMVCYDVTNRETFHHATRWIQSYQDVTGDYEIPACLVGNKVDMDRLRQVDTEEATTLAAQNNMFFTEASAKDGTNVEHAFEEMVRRFVVHAKERNLQHRTHQNGPGTGGGNGTLQLDDADTDVQPSCWQWFKKVGKAFEKVFASNASKSVSRMSSSTTTSASSTAASARANMSTKRYVPFTNPSKSAAAISAAVTGATFS